MGAAAITWKGSAWLETSAKRLSAHYSLPPIVEGAVVMAVGFSFPEISMIYTFLFADAESTITYFSISYPYSGTNTVQHLTVIFQGKNQWRGLFPR